MVQQPLPTSGWNSLTWRLVHSKVWLKHSVRSWVVYLKTTGLKTAQVSSACHHVLGAKYIAGWWLKQNPLKNIGQLGWWHSQDMEKEDMFQSTNQGLYIMYNVWKKNKCSKATSRVSTKINPWISGSAEFRQKIFEVSQSTFMFLQATRISPSDGLTLSPTPCFKISRCPCFDCIPIFKHTDINSSLLKSHLLIIPDASLHIPILSLWNLFF